MNLSKSEFRSKDLRFRTNNVGQAFQPAGGDWTSSLPSSAEEAGAAQDASRASAGVVRPVFAETANRGLEIGHCP